MATVYTAGSYADVLPAHPTSGIVRWAGKYTFAAGVAFTAGDSLKIFQIPKGASIVPELCMVGTTADLDADNDFTFKYKATDGTTTKVIIGNTASTALQGGGIAYGNTTAADRQAYMFFKTGTNDFYAVITAEAGELDAAAVLYYQIAFTMDTNAADVIT